MLCVNGDAATLKMLEGVQTPFALTVIALERNEGSARARNACAARARGELLYFSDDDALLRPGILADHLAFHEAHRNCVAVGGVDWETAAGVERMRPHRVSYWNLHGVNTSLAKSDFSAVGGFPEWLTTYGFEDVVLGYALQRRGLRFVALPDSAVRHIGPNPVAGRQPDKVKSAGRNAVLVAEKYPELALRLGVHPLLLRAKRSLLPCLRPLFRAELARRLEGELTYTRAAWAEYQRRRRAEP